MTLFYVAGFPLGIVE